MRGSGTTKATYVLLALFCVALAACGSGEPEAGDASGSSSCAEEFQQPFSDVAVYPVFASSDLAVGPNRFLVGLRDQNDAPVASPKLDMHIDFFNLESCSEEPTASADLDFIWTIKPVVGLFKTNVNLDRAGLWGAEVTIEGDGLSETVKGSFEVAETSRTPGIGDRPPASDTPTASDAKGLSEITTDKQPNPRFYKSSIAEAVRSGKPFVVVFSTPKFCDTQTCGPTLNIVKRVARDFPKITFIHVEPYRLPASPNRLVPVPAANQWGLPSEPWTFVVNDKGRLAAKFEGVLAPAELRSVLVEL